MCGKEKAMLKRLTVLIAVMLGAVIMLSGCETTRGLEATVKGMGTDLYNGFYSSAGFVQSADSWMKKNLW